MKEIEMKDMREVLEVLRANGLHDEAAAVGLVMEQQEELLFFVKEWLWLTSSGDCVNHMKDSAKEIIAKSEA